MFALKRCILMIIFCAVGLFIYHLASVLAQTKNNLQDDYHLTVVDSLHKVFKFKSGIPEKSSARLYMARNEYETFQIVFDDIKKDLKKVTIKVSDLLGSDGKSKILSSFVKVKLVGYVPTKKPYYKTSYVGLWPDYLLEFNQVEVRKGDRQVLWVTVYAPEDIPSGEYKGNIEVLAENADSQSISVNVHLWDFVLPKDPHLKTAFDFYADYISKFYSRKKGEAYDEWKERIGKVTEAYYLNMLQYRISPILNLNPLSEDFDKRITRYLDNGISAFGIGIYGGSFGNNWPQENPNSVISLYSQYAQILRSKNILDKAYIYTWDEGEIGNPAVKKVTEIIHQADPELKNMVCYHGFWEPDKDPEWGKDIDIWCFQIASYDRTKKEKLEKLGKEIWMYVSGPDGAYPNIAIDFPAIDARIIPWMCWKYNIKGFLYWSVNFWRVNPYEDAMNTDWQQNGNGLLYYPGENGPVPSLRLELLRDGLEDYEYFYLLAQKIKEVKDKNLEVNNQNLINGAKNLLNIDEPILNSMSDYTKDAQVILKRRQEIAQTIEELNKLLGESI